MSGEAARPTESAGLTGDLWGGLAAMLVAIPSSIAYGVIAFSPLGPDFVAHGAAAGLLGAVALGLVAPALGGAPRLITAPCAPAAAVMGALAADLVAGGAHDPSRALLLMTLAALLSGGLQVLFGSLGGGKLIKYIPYPVVAGYLSGVGILIMLSQIPKLFGFPKTVPTWEGLIHPELWKWPGIVVGLVTMAVMLLAPRITKKVPAAILGLAAGVAAYFLLAIGLPDLLHFEHNKLIIGPVGGSGVSLWSSLVERFSGLRGLGGHDLAAIWMPALTLSVLLSIDTLKTCVVLDALTRSRHDSNQELLAQGAGNLASAFAGGMPGAGTSGPTFVNVSSGGATKRSGILEGGFVLLAFVLLGGLIGWVPIGALAGILLVVGFRMVDRSCIDLLRHRDTVLDFVVILAVVATAVFKSLIAASGVGVGLATMLFLREQVRSSVIRRKIHGDEISSRQHRLPEEKALIEEHGAELVVCELQGSLFFGTADQLYTEIEPELKSCRFVILDMRRVLSVDFTAAHRLEQMAIMLHERGGEMLFSHLPPSLPTGQDLQRYFQQMGLGQAAHGGARVFNTLGEALEWAEDRILETGGMRRRVDAAPLGLAEHPLLRECDPATIALLRSHVTERSLKPGEHVFRRKDEGDEMYLIRRGGVRILLPLKTGKLHHVVSFARGSFFGEISFLDRKKRTADAVAENEVDLYVLSRGRFDDMSRKDPAAGAMVFARIARELADRLRHTDKEIRRLQDA